jgi:hypothetical protein
MAGSYGVTAYGPLSRRVSDARADTRIGHTPIDVRDRRRRFPSLDVMRTFPALVLSAGLALAAPLLAADPVVAGSVRTIAPVPDPDDPTTWQTSDQVRGEVAAPLTRGMRARTTRTQRYRFKIAPMAHVAAYDERGPRGPVRYYLVRMRWPAAGLRTDYLRTSRVRGANTLSRLVAQAPNAVAGINGDFFDIGDTGAPLGVGIGRGEGVRHGIDRGWNAAFYIPRKGAPDVGTVELAGRIPQFPRLRITNLNSPQVKPGGIGVYDGRWGTAAGFRWTDGQRRDVRVVHIRDGRVKANKTRNFPAGVPVRGRYLVARGAARSAELARLKVGTRVDVRTWLRGNPRVAISGNRILLKDGAIRTADDREMHPRSAVGIDRDHKDLIFVVVDGRQSFSRGHTMLEMARLLKRHGAEDGLNLDGGGSSTIVARQDGRLRVLNRPSDGNQRPIPNGLRVLYR